MGKHSKDGFALRITIPLTVFEAEELERRALAECRDLRGQARYMLLQALGLVPLNGVVIENVVKENTNE